VICIKAIHIEEFRGIRDLTLDLKEENFGICGPNGTGKSGVVDAIEFCLTGNVTRLSGQGQGELSVKSHAPHVDHRVNPDKAKVTITATVPSLGKEVTITRSVKNPRTATTEPADPDVLMIMAELQSHPEFALSRREIAKYIVTPPEKKRGQSPFIPFYSGPFYSLLFRETNFCEPGPAIAVKTSVGQV